jgi:hypothetical protein
MTLLSEMTVINYNPLGFWSKELCEWYFALVQVRNTRKDLLNMSLYN